MTSSTSRWNWTGTGRQKQADVEPSGLQVSNGGTSVDGLVRTSANLENARAFLTRQHGENEVWEIVKNRPRDH